MVIARTAARAHITRAISQVAAATVTVVLVAVQAQAQRVASRMEGPFASFVGSWSGTGKVILANGATERLRCRVSYAVNEEGDTLRQSLRCASDSYKFDLSARARHEAGAISGGWTDTTRNASGSLTGRLAGGRLQVLVERPGFSAELALATKGDRQSVTMRSKGDEVVTVSITLDRTQ